MIKDSHVIRGDSERQVELKVKEFIYVRDAIHDEEWVAEDIQYKSARLFGYKPFSCVLTRVKDDD